MKKLSIMSQRQLDEHQASFTERHPNGNNGGSMSYGPTPGSEENNSSVLDSPSVRWTGTGNMAAPTKVGINPFSSNHRARNQKITKWLRKVNKASAATAEITPRKRPASHFTNPSTEGSTKACTTPPVEFSLPTPGGDDVHSNIWPLASTPNKRTNQLLERSESHENVDLNDTLRNLLSLELDSSLRSPARKRRRISSQTESILNNSDHSVTLTENISNLAISNVLNDTLDFQIKLKKFLHEDKSSIPEINLSESKNSVHSQTVLDTTSVTHVPFAPSSTQVHTTLPKEADSSWTNARLAHLESIRFKQRASFLNGALQNNCLEDWAIQIDRLPNFLMRIPEFRSEYHKMRIEHAKATMILAAKHLSETARANKATAKALKGAAIVLTEETLGVQESKEILDKAKEEWEKSTKKTIAHEHKLLEERKTKLEKKPFTYSDIIDPLNRLIVKPGDNDSSTSSTRGRQDFGRRGRGGYRGRGRRGRKPTHTQSRPPTKNKNKD